MKLKDFQQDVVDILDRYLDALNKAAQRSERIGKLNQEDPDLQIQVPDFTATAWERLQEDGLLPKTRMRIPFSGRQDEVGRPVPALCLKVPTAGGKTLLAAACVSRIMAKWVRKNCGFVLWIVPNEAIYTQTRKALSDREHPYRQILDRAAAGRVKIFEKHDPLDRRDVDTHLCVMLLMLQAANRETKETLRMFRDRGNVHGFFPAADDVMAHAEVIRSTPNMDVYGDREILGAIVKDSLGNALRAIRPVVVMDEGHKGYSRLAMRTLYGFNPCFVLELSATPGDRPRDLPPMYSNWLVDVRGTDLDKEAMIKLPINVTVRGGDDWRDCLRESYEHLNRLQTAADRLGAETSRYLRPICLVQVERTGKDQREAGLIHADDARDYLLTLGVHEKQIAIKTAEKNELKDPENLELLSPLNQIRFIITKQALQEGWDCPFAYVLCSLAPVTKQSALTQLVGRILRQPDTIKTGYAALDECYVFCHHAATREVVEAIKTGLEQDGMADLVDEIRDANGNNGSGVSAPQAIERRAAFRRLQIYLPMVNWVEGDTVRPLDYEQDILHRLRWDEIKLEGVADKLVAVTQTPMTQTLRIGLADGSDPDDFLEIKETQRTLAQEAFDSVYAVRSIVDRVPNPWIARELLGTVMAQLNTLGLDRYTMGARQALILETLRSHLTKERDRLAEELFVNDVQAGRIQFRLRTDRLNWTMPHSMTIVGDPNRQELRRDDGKIAQKSLFEPIYKDDLNTYERMVACYLDGETALRWWHRNVAKHQYALQGWRKPKVYPDFLYAVTSEAGRERLVILESKGEQLAGNLDTEYKKKLLALCTNAYRFEKVKTIGQLEMVVDDENTTVSCAMVYEPNWKADLAQLLAT
jgi:type III restriction enzyme